MTKQLIETFAARPIPEGCCTESGRWLVSATDSRDVTIAEGADVELLVVDKACAVTLNIDVMAGAKLRIVHLVAERSGMELALALAADAECRMTQIVVSPSDVRVVASLVERGARFELNGAFILTINREAVRTLHFFTGRNRYFLICDKVFNICTCFYNCILH